MSTSIKYSNDTSNKNVKQKLFKSMIASLLNLIVSHFDIAFSV